ncbi:MAG TPA: ABC transporter substrate-binding protein [Chthoniobacterales bacterium]
MAYPGLFTRLLLVLTLAGSAACKKDTAKNTPDGLTAVTLLTDWYPQPEHGGFYNALVKGYYKEAGLDVTILPGGPNVFGIQRVAVGNADFGMSTGDDIMVANERKLPLIAVGPTMQHDPQGVMVHPETGITDFPQLEGKNIAMIPGSLWFLYLTKKYGWKNVTTSPATFNVANFLSDPHYIQQVFVTSEPFFVQKTGQTLRVLLLRDAGFDPYRVFFTRRDFLEKKPEVVRAFVGASLRGWKDYMADPTAANEEIHKRNPEMDTEKMTYSWKALQDGKFIDGRAPGQFGKFDPARWRKQYENLRSIGVLTEDADPARSYTMEFLPK